MRGGQPFARAAAQFALIAAAMALANPLARSDALAAIPGYASRGKHKTRYHPAGGHLRVRRAAAKRRNVLRNRKAHR